ncbi:hypothetical protein T03_12578 [Trichinella britovi]|uniref:Uncharacterized protein n=1 Tax=Trichinella britovi TaxID=45882 RepID=A0A0V1C2T4_TRIBR|nr:hypothetical protein T03_12578 [Trichinella britovi]
MSFQRPLYQPRLCHLPYGDSRLTAERLQGIVLPQHTHQDKHAPRLWWRCTITSRDGYWV